MQLFSSYPIQFNNDVKIINNFGGYNRNRTNNKPIFQYIFSVHIQKQNTQSVFEKRMANTENKDRMIPIQQLLKIIERISVYSFFYRIFSQFQYVFSQDLSASHHHFVKHFDNINFFGGNNYCAKHKVAR